MDVLEAEPALEATAAAWVADAEEADAAWVALVRLKPSG